MIRKRFIALLDPRFIWLAALSAAFGLLYFYSQGDQRLSLVWLKATGSFTGQPLAIAERTGWGQTYPGVEMHATMNDDPNWLWRVSAELPDGMKHFGGSISIALTQPEWSVFDRYRRVYQGTDGVDVRFFAESESGINIIDQVSLNLGTRADERQWKSLTLKIPAGTKRLLVEASPGPPGSNNWHDRVFLAAKQIQTTSEEKSRYLTASMLVGVLYLSGLAICYCGGWMTLVLPRSLITKTLYSGVALFLLLFGARSFDADFGFSTLSSPSFIFLIAYSDAAYAGSLAGICLVLLYIVRFRARAQLSIYYTYILICSISLSLSIVNREMMRLLGGPFNYQWLYYSDFLSGQTARASLFAYIPTSAPLLGTVIIVNAIFFCIVVAIKQLEGRTQRELQTHLGATAIFFIGICIISQTAVAATKDYDSIKLANPVVAFLKSAVATNEDSRLFSMPTAIGTEDFEPVRHGSGKIANRNGSQFPPIKNIVVFVLESGAAEYIYNWNIKSPELVPEIQKYRRQAATFTNIYTHVPASNKSLVSILTSVYPMISYRSLTQESPRARLTSVSTVLRRRGYRTGFFSSGDFRFQRGDEFLSYQQFETIIAYNNLRCARSEFRNSSQGPFQNSFEDACLFAPFTDWLTKDSNQPFFAVLWPVQMHHPYTVTGPEINFGVAEEFNRYLNALHQTDRLLGELLRWLDSRSILDSTLVVVVGDHGEAFEQHGQRIHASHIYEENIHVPLILINRRLFKGEQYDTIGGLVDVVPTVMDILGYPNEAGWQGRSLFDHSRNPRTYFFAPYSRFLFGMREGSLKLIIDAAVGKSELYDLKTDPGERTNLSSAHPEFVRTGEQRIAAWVQYQNRMYKHLLTETKPKM